MAHLHSRSTIGTAALLLLFIGINNAWDAVAYHALVNKPNTKDRAP